MGCNLDSMGTVGTIRAALRGSRSATFARLQGAAACLFASNERT
jgi:hypothetical protein